MAKTTETLDQIAEVIREGRHIVLPAVPKPMETRVASDLLRRLADQEEEPTMFDVTFPTPPYAGAVALANVLERLFGFVVRSMGADMTVRVPTGPGEHQDVSFNAFDVPGTSIIVGCGVGRLGNMACFRLQMHCLTKEKALGQQLIDEIRKEIVERSIYKGKAIQIAQSGASLDLQRPDSIRFMRTNHKLRDSLVLNSETREAVENELFAPIEHFDFARSAWGVNMNRVVLLSGTYGTGKSLTGSALAAVAVENNATFILLKNVTALPEAMELARLMELPRVVIFAEDVDRVMSGDRDSDKDTLLNLLSGVESATTEVQVVLTTNNVEAIHPAMIRRFQAVVEYQLPDADAVAKLIKLYGNGRVGKLDKAPKVLAGNLPSLIKDTVETAKLSAIRHGRHEISDDDLVYAARQLETRARLATREVKPDPLEKALAQVGSGLANGQSELLANIAHMVERIEDRV